MTRHAIANLVLLVAAALAAAPAATITGTVTQAGKPVAGMQVRLTGGTGPAIPNAKTDGSGVYAFTVPPGQYTVAPWATLLAPTPDHPSSGFTLAGGQTATANFTMQAKGTATPAAAIAAPLPGLLTGTGTPTTQPTYTTSVNGTAWLDASAVSSTRADRRLWHLATGAAAVPDPRHAVDPAAYPTATVDPDDALTGQTAVAVYTTSGPHAVTCDVTRADGSTATYGQAVVVPVDARPAYWFASSGSDANTGDAAHPKLSAAAFAALATHGNCRLYLAEPLALPAGVYVGSNTLVEGVADAGGNKPCLTAGPFGGTNVFQVNSTVAHVLVRGVLFDAGRWAAPLPNGVRQAATQPSGGRAEAIISFGQDVVLDGCDLGCLVRGAEADGGDGFALLRCRQPDPRAIGGQVVSLWGPCRACVAFDDLTGGFAEAVFRTDGQGSANGLTLEYDRFAQTDPTCAPGAGKAAVDIRACSAAVIGHNAVGGLLSVSDGWAQNSAVDLLVAGNVYRQTTPAYPGQFVILKGRCVGVTVAGEDFGPMPPGGVAVSVTGDPAQSDLTIGTSSYAAGVKQLAATGVTAGVLTVTAGK